MSGAYIKVSGQKDESIEETVAKVNSILADGIPNMPQTQEALEEEKQRIVDTIEDYMLTYMSVSFLKDVLAGAEREFGIPEEKMKNAKQRGGEYGRFVEESIFGMPKDSRAKHDLEDIMTEIKTHSGKRPVVQVGDITVYNILAENMEDEQMMFALAIYKMVEKMRNFIYFRVKDVWSGFRRKSKFTEVSLWYGLIISELVKALKAKARSQGRFVAIQRKSGVKKNEKTNELQVTYEVKISMKKLDNVYKITQLYLDHIDILQKMRDDYGDMIHQLYQIEEFHPITGRNFIFG